MSAHKHGICSMTTVVRCPRTGRPCSEVTCRERHWRRKMFERGLSHRGLPLKRKFRPRCCAKTRAGAPCIMRVVPPDLAVLVEPLLIVRQVVREQLGILHRRLLAIVQDDDVCRRLMTIPGVGPVVALTYRVTVDVPARFRNSKAVGAVFGLTPSKYQSGQNERSGGI